MSALTFSDNREPVIVYYNIELDDAALSPFAFRVYLRIARRCLGVSTGRCQESLQSIAEACNISRSAVTRSIKELINRNFIARIGGTGIASQYALLDKKNWLATYPALTEPPTRLSQSHPPALTEPPPGSHRATPRLSQSHYLNINTEREKREAQSAKTAPPLTGDFLALYTRLLGIYGLKAASRSKLAEQLKKLSGELEELSATADQVEMFYQQRTRKPPLAVFAGDFASWRNSLPAPSVAASKKLKVESWYPVNGGAHAATGD